VEITDALGSSLPDCRTAIVEGASHFLITTHAEQCAKLLSSFLADLERDVFSQNRFGIPICLRI